MQLRQATDADLTQLLAIINEAAQATAIYLAHDPVEWLEPDYPYLRVAIWQPLAHLSGGSWRVASSDTAAAAWYFSGPNELEIASAGRVAVGRVDADFSIEGMVDLRFPSRHIVGGFRAAWISRAVICG